MAKVKAYLYIRKSIAAVKRGRRDDCQPPLA